MIQGNKVLAIIPARGGSKGVPRKNIRTLAGKPLIAWTIEEAKKSKFIDRLVLSSEDAEIIAVAKRLNCDVPFIRPAELSQDNTPGIEPVLHALRELPGYEYVVLLQPTSPLRTVEDIDGCIRQCVLTETHACVTLTETAESPYWMYQLDTDLHLQPLLTVGQKKFSRRQDLPKTYILNGAVYVAECSTLINQMDFIHEDTTGYLMPRERSIDIDSEIDIFLCESWLKSAGIPQDKT